jgi:hypothetical protein
VQVACDPSHSGFLSSRCHCSSVQGTQGMVAVLAPCKLLASSLPPHIPFHPAFLFPAGCGARSWERFGCQRWFSFQVSSRL